MFQEKSQHVLQQAAHPQEEQVSFLVAQIFDILSTTPAKRKLNNLTCSLAFLDFNLPVIIILSGLTKDKIIPGGSRTDMAMADLILPGHPRGTHCLAMQ